MASKANGLKLHHLFILTFLFITLSLLVLTAYVHLRSPLYHLENSFFEEAFHLSNHVTAQNKYYSLFDFLSRKLQGREIKIGLVNMHREEEEEEEEENWKELGATTMVHFDRVPKERRWEDYFPEWIDEDERWGAPKCPDLPMPTYKNYDEFNVVVVRMPCGEKVRGKGIRDVFRLQVNLVAANLVVNNGEVNQSLFVVFISSCGPMWEIFRCDDLLKHEGMFWIYRPDVRRLQQKVLMPVGTCQLAATPKKQGEGKLMYDFSKLSSQVDHPREAYVSVIHSSETYVCGAIVLAQSIIQTNSTKDLVLLADQSITRKSRQALRAAGWKIKVIKRIRNPHAERNTYNEWNYSKLRVWQLSEYDKVIFIDSDVIVLENLDEFFVYPQLSAARNDKVLFNSGIMLIEPSDCVFEMLLKKRFSVLSYNGGDQGFLNEVFTWWHRWPTNLNFLKIFTRVKHKRYKLPESIYTIHYLGVKPWKCTRDHDCNWDRLERHIFASDAAHWKWWQVYDNLPKGLHPSCGSSRELR